MTEPKVVVTGVGFAVPLGAGSEDVFDRFVAGEDGFVGDTILDYPVALTPLPPAEEIMGSKREARRSDRVTHMMVVASDAALAHAGIEADSVGDPNRAGAIMGTAIGGVSTLVEQDHVYEERGPDRVSPFLVPMFMPNALSGTLSLRYGFGGPNFVVVTACASGANAVGEAAQEIRSGKCDIMISGGADACALPLTIAAFGNLQALTRTGVRPFDAGRDGFAMGEGAGVVVLESEDHARRRGARILCEVAGYGRTADAYHITAPHPDGAGAVRAIRMALDEAGLDPSDVGYVNAHGTSTPLNDASEANALHTVFGEDAPPTSSVKSMIGHLIGGAGGVEAAVTAMAIAKEVLPPTIKYAEEDPAIALDVVPNEAREAKGLEAAISNSFGFGGHNAVLAFRRY